MTSAKSFYSLPKTQPTSSSSKSKLNTIKTYLYQNNSTCPQVSSFNITSSDLNQQKYVHNMKIDYGKLQKPYKLNLKLQIQKQLNLNNDLQHLLSTKKINNIKQYTQNDKFIQYNNKQVTQPNIHSLLTHKSINNIEKFSKTINPQSGTKSSTQKKKTRILSVKAYQILNKSRLQENNPRLITDRTPQITDRTIEKEKSKTQLTNRTPQLTNRKQDRKQELRSSRKISHSRIIKTFNPTAGLQTKIITYPDLSDVIKFRQSRRK